MVLIVVSRELQAHVCMHACMNMRIVDGTEILPSYGVSAEVVWRSFDMSQNSSSNWLPVIIVNQPPCLQRDYARNGPLPLSILACLEYTGKKREK